MVTYGTVKAAFAQLTRLLAVELAPSVRVNGIAPGVVETDGLKAVLNDELRARIISATPLHRLSTVADVANAARWLASPAASYVTGKVIEIDGGAKPSPSQTTRLTSRQRASSKHPRTTSRYAQNGAEGNTAATPTAFLPELRGRKEPTLTRENHFARHPVQPTGRGEGTGWLRVPGVS
jgi:Enoyl-(Acyl carrier protein) reductase